MGDVNGGEALEALYRLQEKDLELDELKREREELPQELVEVQSRYGGLEERLTRLIARQSELQREYNRHSLDIQDLTEKERLAEEEQRRAQSLREQTQYENRIQQLKDRIRELKELSKPLEDSILDLEEEIETLREELAQLRPRLEALLEANQARVAELDQIIQQKEAERNRMAEGLPANLLKEYEAIRRARRGTGVARMLKQGNTFRCEGCNVVLPTHVAQKVMQGQLVRCPSCGRLLWKG
ncbi:MAG: zinc ribbon domain-containing protein [Thermaceae bacterium]